MVDRWSDLPGRISERSRRGPAPLEQGFDRLVTAGRQLVGGVSGARPGSRPAGRSSAPAAGERPRLADLGRWVENRLDWILDDEDWREPWQQDLHSSAEPRAEPRLSSRSAPPAEQGRSSRRPLDAISRRGQPSPERAVVPGPGADDDDWPQEESFARSRWQRPPGGSGSSAKPSPALPEPVGPAAPGRPLPRSSRRRQP